MIYCNKRKEHIEPALGQVWVVYDTDKKIGRKYVEIIHICNKKRTYPVLVESEDGSVCGFTTHGLNRFDHLQLTHLEGYAKPRPPWQPIETKPKDGDAILVHHETKGVIFAHCMVESPQFTHWMPLPDAPKTEGV